MMLCKAMPWARFVMVRASTGRRAWRLSLALDKTVDVVATAAAALLAVDVEHIELADNVAEWIAAFRLAALTEPQSDLSIAHLSLPHAGSAMVAGSSAASCWTWIEAVP